MACNPLRDEQLKHLRSRTRVRADSGDVATPRAEPQTGGGSSGAGLQSGSGGNALGDLRMGSAPKRLLRSCAHIAYTHPCLLLQQIASL